MSDEESEKSGRELAAEALCDQSRKLVAVFTIAMVFLLVQVPYLIVVERSSSLFVVAVLNVVGSGGFAALSGSALWFCNQRPS